MKGLDKTKGQPPKQIKRLKKRPARPKQEKLKGRRANKALGKALEESQGCTGEISALLEGSRAVLEHREFKDSARSIFDSCRALIGAKAGYVALLNKDGTENEVLFLDSGGLPCTVDPNLPMPIRGLRREAYRSGKALYDNDFLKSEWMKFMPEGHAGLHNVLFAPLIIKGKTVGLVGLANKEGGFTENDARTASAFGKLAAIALHNSQMLESLEHREEQFRSVVQTASDAVVSVDGWGNIIFWNTAAETTFGYSAEEAVGKPLISIMPERFRKAHKDGMRRLVSAGRSNTLGKTVEVIGLRKDGREFPLELSVAVWMTKEGIFFTGIMRDISKRKQMEAEKEALIQELEAKNAELERYAYTVSHDLKSPLITIKGFLGLLERDAARGDTQRMKIDMARISDGVSRMQRLLDELLEISRIGRVVNPPQRVPLGELACEAVDMVGGRVAERRAHVRIAPTLPVVYGDRARLREVLENLVDNAVKFMGDQPHPCVEIGVRRDGEETILYVRDNGVGIEPHYQEKVFGLFDKLDRKTEGTGVGLCIAKRIVEVHGGRIWVESEGLGRGSTFCLSLPGSREAGSTPLDSAESACPKERHGSARIDKAHPTATPCWGAHLHLP